MADLLFLCHRIPYPPTKGDKIRAWHLFAHLAKRHRIHLGCFLDDVADAPHVAHLQAMCASMHCVTVSPPRQRLLALLRARPGRPLTLGYFDSASMRRWVAATRARVSATFVFSSGMAHYVGGRGNEAWRVLDMVDIDSEKFAAYARQARGPSRWIWSREARTLFAFERQCVALFDQTLFVSSAECRRFAELAPETAGRVAAVENGVDLAYFSPEFAASTPFTDAGPQIVFTGTMDYRPNIDAMRWFVQQVMPGLRDRVPAPRLTIVGANPSTEIEALAGPDVAVTGRVDDVRPYLAHSHVVVAPLLLARGIQNKVLEAMAMGRHVVASRQAFEGVKAQAGRDLLVADGAADMVAAIGSVLDGLHPAMGYAARGAMSRGYAWRESLDRLDALIEQGVRADLAVSGERR